MNYATILPALLVLLGGLSFSSVLIHRDSHLAWVTLMPYLILWVLLCLFGIRNRTFRSPLIWYFLFFTLLFFVVRATFLSPDLNGLKYQMVGLHSADVASLGWDLVLMMALTWGSLEIWFRGLKKNHRITTFFEAPFIPIPNIQAVLVSLLLILAVLVRFWLSVQTGYGRHTETAHAIPILLKAGITIFNISFLSLLVCFFLMSGKAEIKKQTRVICVLALCISVGLQTLMSSKSAILQVLAYLSFFVFLRKTVGCTKKSLGVVAVICMAAVIAFNLAKQLRTSQFYMPDRICLKEYCGLIKNISPAKLFAASAILERFSGIDSVINLQQENQWIRPEFLIRLDNDFLSILNWALPGRPFSVILTSQAYAVIYGDKTWQSFFIGDLYTTHLYTLFGLGYSYWGRPLCFLTIPLLVLGFVHAFSLLDLKKNLYAFITKLLIMNTFFWLLNAPGFDEIIIIQIETFLPVYLFAWGNHFFAKRNLLFS